MPATLTPQDFVAKWRRSELKESAADREHFIDLCRLIGHETPAEADSTGANFTFQYGASKLGGGQGFADVFKRGCFGWEYKGKHANLDRAYQQLLQYRESLHNPPDASEAELKKRTLTNLYNARPAWLDNAHRRLDAAVFAAYGWPVDLSDEGVLERLLALNGERATVRRKGDASD